MQTLFQADDIAVYAETQGRSGGDGWCCVTFAERQRLPLAPFGRGYLARQDIPAIILVPSDNSDYLTDGVPLGARAAAEHAHAFHRLTYGSSMGAFGAIAHARSVGARRVLAISPQIGWAHRMHEPYAQRRKKLEDDVRVIAARLTGSLDDCEVLLLFDPHVEPDRVQAAAIHAAAPNRVLLQPIPFAGHPVGKRLAQAGLLSWLLRTCLSDVRLGRIAATLRRRWRVSPVRRERVARAFERHAATRPYHRPWARRLAAGMPLDSAPPPERRLTAEPPSDP